MNHYSSVNCLWAILSQLILLSLSAMAVDIAVPSPDEIIANSDVVAIGEFAADQDSIFVVSEVIKAPAQAGRFLKVNSPYPEMSFPMTQFKAGLGQSPTILVGQWDVNSQAVIASYGGCSFWPQGTPTQFLPYDTVDKLRLFIRERVGGVANRSNANHDKGSHPPSAAASSNAPDMIAGNSPSRLSPPSKGAAPPVTTPSQAQPPSAATQTKSWSSLPIVPGAIIAALLSTA